MRLNVKAYLPRTIFLVSVLALLATSKPRGWTLSATIAGPTAPTTPHGLRVVIDATEQPDMRADGVAATFGRGSGTPCAAAWSRGTKLTCLLPRDTTLKSVSIEGACGGCSGGGCPPPPGAFVNVTTSEVDVWRDDERKAIVTTLPSHPAGPTATTFVVTLSGAQYVQVLFKATPRTGGPPAFREEQSCSSTGVCTFQIDDALAAGDFDITADGTGWGECTTGSPCSPPGTFHVISLDVVK